MGLIDELRRKKDSWDARLEEHRRNEEQYLISENKSEKEVEKEIYKNRSKVGVFDFRDDKRD